MRTNVQMAQSQTNKFSRLQARLMALPLPQRWRQQLLTLGMGWTLSICRATSSIELSDFGPTSATLRVTQPPQGAKPHAVGARLGDVSVGGGCHWNGRGEQLARRCSLFGDPLRGGVHEAGGRRPGGARHTR